MSKLSVHVAAPIVSVDELDVGSWINITRYIDDDLEFSTGLPGGYLEASMTLTLPSSQAAWWYETMLAADIRICDSGEPVWEGRVNNIRTVRRRVSILCRGYWSALTDLINYGFWSDAGHVDGTWIEPQGGIHALASHADNEARKYRVTKTSSTITIAATGEASEHGFVALIWTFSPDISGANAPKAAPRAGFRIKGHLEALSVFLANVRLRLYYTDNPYVDTLGADGADGDWIRIKEWFQELVATDFSFDIAYDAATKPYAFMIYAGANTPAEVAGWATFSELEVRAIRSDDNSGKVTAKRVMEALLVGDSDLGLSSPEHLCLSTETMFMDDPDFDVAPFISEGQNAQEIATKLASYSNSGAVPKEWFPAVWAQRRFYLNAKETDSVHWIVSKEELGESGAEFERTLEDYWPYVYAHHLDSKDRPQWSTLKSDPFSSEPLPLYRRLQLSVDVSQGAVRDAVRDAQFDFSKRPPQQAQIILSGKIMSSFGAMYPLWRVRAGDTILIRDLASKHFMDEEGNVVNALHSFFVRETGYNLASNELTITPGFPTNRMDILTARLTDLTFE